MAAKNNYMIISEAILRDPMIEDLILQGGYAAFGYYIAILSIMRDYKDFDYKLPIKRLDIIAGSRLMLYDAKDRETFAEHVGLMLAIGLLKKNEDCIWSDRRRLDLIKQDESRAKMSEAGVKGMAARYGNRDI